MSGAFGLGKIEVDEKYIELGMIKAWGPQDKRYTYEALLDKVRDKAVSIGADGIIVESSGQLFHPYVISSPRHISTGVETSYYMEATVIRFTSETVLPCTGRGADAVTKVRIRRLLSTLSYENLFHRFRRCAAEGEAVIPALIDALRDKSVRKHAAMVLGKIGPEVRAAVPALSVALKDKNTEVRRFSVLALGEIAREIGPEAKAAVPALIDALTDETADVRVYAAMVLGKIGPEAKAAVPVLIDALKDKEESVRVHAAEALKKISK